MPEPEKEKFTLVLFSGELDKALAAFILATTAASMGMEVTMFFTFWGLNAIKRNEGRIKSKGIMRNMLNIMNRGGSKRLKMSHFHMFGLGTWMMRKLMKESNYPSIDEFISLAQEMGIKMVPCSTSCGILGLPDDAFRDGIMSQAGAAYFLAQARESRVTLFI
ncbi:MAG: DsrE/DsrF/DrsH-like family protein [Dehalococcoidales bacterium]|nr:DsrE/DsrF/DrsH-like family protein [Dehalococcoidales bacterium]